MAATHLREKGYSILERNWRCNRGEIDLIVKTGHEYVFVEVKTRRGRAMGTPEEGLTKRKSQKVVELAKYYLAQKDLDVDWRVDLVAVELDANGELQRVEHIPNAILSW